MTLSAPSFLAAATRASMPPRSAADFAVLASEPPPDAEPPEPLSVGGEHATIALARIPVAARTPARRPKWWDMCLTS